MSRNLNNKLGLSPDSDYHKPITTTTTGFYRKQGYVVGNKKKRVAVVLGSSRISQNSGDQFSPISFLERIGEKVANALRFMSSRKKSSRKVSSASLAKSRSYAETLHDSQRAEAIEDCIEFLNSSSSLQRSSSVSSSC